MVRQSLITNNPITITEILNRLNKLDKLEQLSTGSANGRDELLIAFAEFAINETQRCSFYTIEQMLEQFKNK